MHQQNIYQQFPNFNHPPPPIEQSFPPIDDSIIEHFLIDRNHLTIQTNGEKVFSHFNINGKDRLNVIKINLNNLIKQQQIEETYMRNNITQMSTSLWEEKINLLKINQTKIATLLTKFEELSSKTKSTNITKKGKRRYKRKIKKNQKSNLTEENKSLKDTEAPIKRQQVDEDLQESYKKLELERLRSLNLKRISECKRQLTFLDSLIDLRCIRQKNSNVSGSSKATSEKHFNEKISALKSKWTEALKKFNSLENELKMSLTSTTSVSWMNALFSNDTNPPLFDEPMDFKRLLDIR